MVARASDGGTRENCNDGSLLTHSGKELKIWFYRLILCLTAWLTQRVTHLVETSCASNRSVNSSASCSRIYRSVMK